MSAIAATSVLRELEAICGREHLLDNPAQLQSFAIDAVVPAVAVSPASPAEVAAVLRFASEHGLVLVPAGGFTHQCMGGSPERVDILLRTQRLNAIEHYDPGDLTIGIGAGTTVAEVHRLIASHRQLFPLDPPQAEDCTIGGALATAVHGPQKHGYGGVRDYCIGIRFVTADGKLAKAGGRVVKNVAGYDLMKLLIGSFGTLAVIVGASFKLYPAPRQTRTFVSSFAGLGEALRFRDLVLRSPLSPMCLELASPHAHPLLSGFPADDSWRVLLRAGGSDAVLARYRAELGGAVAAEISGDAEPQFWRDLATWPHTLFNHAHNAALVRLDLPLQAVEHALTAAERAALDSNFVCAAVGRIGVGSLLVAFLPVGAPAAVQYANAISALRAALPRDAAAIVLRCPREAKRHFSVWGSSSNDVETMRVLHDTFDPKQIMNRGRFLF